MVKPLVTVIGHGDSGKTTIVRSFTGSRGGANPIFEKNIVWGPQGKDGVFVLGASPQEKHGFDAAIIKKFLSKVARDSRLRGVVIAMQPRNYGKAPMVQILKDAKALGFRIVAGIIDPPYKGPRADTKGIKQALQNVAAAIGTLDGREFPDQNAAKLRKLSNLYK